MILYIVQIWVNFDGPVQLRSKAPLLSGIGHMFILIASLIYPNIWNQTRCIIS